MRAIASSTRPSKKSGRPNGEHAQVGVALLPRKHAERLLEVADRPLDVTLVLPCMHAELRSDSRGWVREADLLEVRDCLLEVRSRFVPSQGQRRHAPGPLVQLGALEAAFGELERLLEVPSSILVRRDRLRPLAGLDKRCPRFGAKDPGVGRVGIQLERRQIVRGDDLGEGDDNLGE